MSPLFFTCNFFDGENRHLDPCDGDLGYFFDSEFLYLFFFLPSFATGFYSFRTYVRPSDSFLVPVQFFLSSFLSLLCLLLSLSLSLSLFLFSFLIPSICVSLVNFFLYEARFYVGLCVCVRARFN